MTRFTKRSKFENSALEGLLQLTSGHAQHVGEIQEFIESSSLDWCASSLDWRASIHFLHVWVGVLPFTFSFEFSSDSTSLEVSMWSQNIAPKLAPILNLAPKCFPFKIRAVWHVSIRIVIAQTIIVGGIRKFVNHAENVPLGNGLQRNKIYLKVRPVCEKTEWKSTLSVFPAKSLLSSHFLDPPISEDRFNSLQRDPLAKEQSRSVL